ncbi:MAG: hypothetical protein EA402_04060 [Planctomycetota bacterium]|nr:MAG: hypothetical protein EA402_04060 [Planctomycetota bacterium]
MTPKQISEHGAATEPSPDAIRKALAATQQGDFDGHTAFAHLTPAQRLDALGRMITVVAEFKGLAKGD